jgi:hypothetical protein
VGERGGAHDHARGLFRAEQRLSPEGEGGDFAPIEMERIDGIPRLEREVIGGDRVPVPGAHGLLGNRLGDGNFVYGVFGQRNANGVAQTIHQQAADADGALDAPVFAVAGFGDSEVEGIVHRLLGHALHEQAVGLDHDLWIRRLHGKNDGPVIVAFGDPEEFQRTLDHAEGRVAVAVHDPIGE